MQVLAYDPYLEELSPVQGITHVDSLAEILAQSDIITLHIPLTAQTHHMFGSSEFTKMKNSAYLINMARGPIVNETALIEALKSRLIAGVALDVFEQEPPSEQNELFTMDNAVFSPHNAALTRESKEKMSLHAAMGVIDVLQGRRPTWPVNQLF
jgi:D-3-phosphoglycerate dehydrogenase